MKKKRGLKTQLLVTSLVLTCFLSSFSYVQAQGSEDITYFNFTHGQMSQIYYYDPMYLNVLQFNLDNNYSGTIRLNFSYSATNMSQNLDYWDILVDGAKIDQYFNNSSNSYIVFHVYNVQFFTVSMVYHTTGTVSSNDIKFKFTSASSSLTASTDPVASDVDSIDTKLTTTNSTLSTISSRLQTANGYFVDILSNTNDIETYLGQQFNGQYDSDVEQLLSNIQLTQGVAAGNIADCEDYLNNIKNQMTTIRSILGTIDIQNPQDSILDCINSIKTSEINLESKVNDIYNQLITMSNTLNTISSTLSSILSTVQNIDNLIDTISWNSYESDFYWSTEPTADRTLWSNEAINSNLYKTLYIYFKVPTDPGNKLVRFTRRMYANSNNQSLVIEPYGIVGGSISIANFNIWTTYQRPFVEIYIYPPFNFSIGSTNYICCKVTSTNNNTYIYLSSSDAAKGFINTTDIEYWQLISYFDQMKQYSNVNTFDQQLYSKLNEILTAINNLNLSVNVSDQDVQEITNNFDTDIDTIHNIENNYGLNFDGWDDQLNPADLNMDLTGYSDTVNLFKSNISALWQSPLVSLPILLSCLCFIFLVILG